jgi:MFS superfamily sulfate permease-like transporter|tara:strand:+ start:10707 stop:12908 length:2202 start_codon:yes stop_codon:yes gene_type:complete
MQIVPKTGLKGLVENWQSDLLASISVALVALPLGLAVAFASGFEPIAGIISAIVGGIVATLFRGSHLAINGPAAGLIAVILGSIVTLDDGSGQALNYVLAAFVISGAFQVILGFLKLGRFADIFHPTVIRGILAGIGVIIVAKQIHLALGTEATSTRIIDDLIGVVTHFTNINPFVAVISLMGLILLVWHAKISYKLFHFLPAPIWVLLLSIPLVYLFNFFEPHSISLLGRAYNVGPDLLVNIPDNLWDAIIHPNFSKIGTLPFWLAVISITTVSTIITLASSKAIDKLDPYKRRTNLNKDLIGVGLATMVSGAIGGLPIVTVIVRSTVNVNNHAKTKWSNFYHGLLLILFIFILAPFIQQVPLAALAILLVYNGFKLASPRVFKLIYKQGVEQVIYFMATLVLVIFTDILTGILGGLLLALIIHFIMSKVSVTDFFKMIFKSGTKMKESKDGKINIKVKGIANFLGTLKYDKMLRDVPDMSIVKVDMSEARLVDLSILELTYEFKRLHESNGGKVEIMGLNDHVSSSAHKYAMRINTKETKKKMTSREKSVQIMAMRNGWDYAYDPVHDSYFESFYFFKSRPIEFKSNRISGSENDMDWEIADITFKEGAYLALEEFQTTVEMIRLPFLIPKFTIEKKGILDKYLKIREHKDIDYKLYPNFSSQFKVKVEDQLEMDDFIANGLRELIQESDIHHIESNGEAILIFNDQLRLARLDEYDKIIKFSEDLRKLLW